MKLAFLIALTLFLQPTIYKHESALSGHSAVPKGACTSSTFQKERIAGAHLAAQGRLSLAIARLVQAHDQCPQNYQISTELAAVDIEAGDYNASHDLLYSLLRKHNSPGLHALLGQLALAKHDYKTAALEYQTAAAMRPDEDNIFAYGTALFHLSYADAAIILRYGVKKFPRSVRMRVALATVLYAQGSSLEGARFLCEAAKMAPLDPHPMEILAETGIVPMSIQPEALRLLGALRQKYPNDGTLLFDYTMVESKRWSGDPTAVPAGFITSVKRALALNARMPEAYYQLALVYSRKHDYRDEISALREAISLDSANARYYYKLAFAYRSTGKQKAFLQALHKYQSLHDRQLPAD